MELRKLYYAEKILFETTGSYSNKLDVLLETLSAYAPNDCNKTAKNLSYQIETTSRTFLISCPSLPIVHICSFFIPMERLKKLQFFAYNDK